jgi:hypothetical protein
LKPSQNQPSSSTTTNLSLPIKHSPQHPYLTIIPLPINKTVAPPLTYSLQLTNCSSSTTKPNPPSPFQPNLPISTNLQITISKSIHNQNHGCSAIQ